MPHAPAAEDPRARPSDLLRDGRALLTGVLVLGVWLNAVDALVTATVMPSVAREVGGYTYFAWATAGFMLGSIVAGAGAGLLSERVGLRRALAFSGLLYAVGCGVSAGAGDIWAFLAGRLVQGAGAGFVVGLCYVAVRASFPERLWSQVFATLSGVWGVATVLGPLVGGLGARHWRSVFWLFAIQAIGFALAVWRLPDGGRPGPARRGGPPLRQLATLSGGVALVAAGGVARRPALAAAAVAGGLALLGATLRLDRRARARLLPRAAVSLASRAGQGYAAIFCLATAAIGFSVYGAALLQARLGLTPLEAGYVVASESLGWTLTAVAVARAPERWRGRLIRLGAVTVAAGVAACALTLSRAGVAAVALSGALLGAGFGLAWSFTSQRILTGLKPEDAAVGAAAIPTLQLLGEAVGSAAAGVLANLLGLSEGFSRAAAAQASPLLLGAFMPVALLGVAAAWRLGDDARSAEDRA